MMPTITISIDDKNVVDFSDILKLSDIEKTSIFNKIDMTLMDINKNKCINGNKIVDYIKNTKMPININKQKITLLALLDFFQKKYVTNDLAVDLTRFSNNVKEKLGSDTITIVSKINNFPHLIGISGIRNDGGGWILRANTREFLDGVLYQWILLSSHEDYNLDYEKLEVFSWLRQTLSNPTYILQNSAIKKTSTKFDADLVFIRRVFNSYKYAFHIVGLKHEKDSKFAFKSQFAIRKDSYHRINKMFDLKEAIYDFFKHKKYLDKLEAGRVSL